MSAPQSWARRAGLGRLVYRYLHRPREQINLARAYGAGLVWRAWRGESAMRAAADRLPFLEPSLPIFSPTILFLTGRRFVHQSLFCAHGLASQAGRTLRCEFLSDGSLAAEHETALRRLFPDAVLPSASAIETRLATVLPPKNYPALHIVRKRFVLLRKLTDAMAGQRGYRLFLDSDMLFWSRPDELVARAESGDPLYMADMVDDGYTASRADLRQKFGVSVAAGVNSGLVGLHAEKIDWDLMERVTAYLQSCPGDQRLLEQTLWAVALGAQSGRVLDPKTYTLVMDPAHWASARALRPQPTLLHYAWRARLPYSAGEWRRYLETLPA